MVLLRPASFSGALYVSGRRVFSFSLSAGRAGRGEEEGSGKTPRGLHTIAEKIGAHAPEGMRFVSRLPTGEVIHDRESHGGENYILTRIIRLAGCEEGKNRGNGVDSFARYIYIHGTNKETFVGSRHFSHGCIVMKNCDIISLFERVEEGEYVYID
ncbi:L,D-transpeptidase [Chitinivibrio alkaliphilus]|nr:L,D-transpeptidase [Chitinivibrio alkaliphilus]